MKITKQDLKNISLLSKIKIDDKTWGYSNPGVWCHSLHEMTKRDNFTSWDDYPEDERID